jgi:hypothetical protein
MAWLGVLFALLVGYELAVDFAAGATQVLSYHRLGHLGGQRVRGRTQHPSAGLPQSCRAGHRGVTVSGR